MYICACKCKRFTYQHLFARFYRTVYSLLPCQDEHGFFSSFLPSDVYKYTHTHANLTLTIFAARVYGNNKFNFLCSSFLLFCSVYCHAIAVTPLLISSVYTTFKRMLYIHNSKEYEYTIFGKFYFSYDR